MSVRADLVPLPETRRWFDVSLTAFLLIACELEVIAYLHRHPRDHHWSLAVNVVIVAAMTIPLAWRRSAPLAAGCITVVSAVVFLTGGIAGPNNSNTGQFVLFIPAYSVAAYSSRPRAIAGLVAFLAGFATVLGLVGGSATSWIFALAAAVGSWLIGRAMRERRQLTVELTRISAQIAAEHEAGERLAVAEQRSRIAIELQTLVASSVSDVIVQARATRTLLDQDLGQANALLLSIEETGRRGLAEMRSILGALRHPDQHVELAPQPGVGQIPALIESARTAGLPVVLSVEGDPGPLPAGVDLGLYRLVENALLSLGGSSDHEMSMLVRFGATDVELQVECGSPACLAWPTTTMSERVALCEGHLDIDVTAARTERLLVRLPRLLGGAFT